MATSIPPLPPLPPLAWTCSTCLASVTGPTCPTCAGAGTSPPLASRPPRPRPAPTGGLTQKKRIIIIGMAGVIFVLCVFCLFFLLARGYDSPSRKPPTPPKPQAQQQQQQPAAEAPATEPAKPSPMPPKPAVRPARVPAAPATKPAVRASVAPVSASSQELVRELRRVNSRLGEIRRVLERQWQPAVLAPPTAQSQPRRREQLSDRELERRYKERLRQREPGR